MFYLQIIQGNYYSILADGNRIRIIPIMASRGDIYDRHGIQLVSNRPGFSVIVIPLSRTVDDNVINKLANILMMKPEEIKNKLVQKTGIEFINIKTDVGVDILTKIKERQNELPTIDVQAQPVRVYNKNELAAHLLGYTGEISNAELKNYAKKNYNDEEFAKFKKQGYDDKLIELLKTKEYKMGCSLGISGIEAAYDRQLRGFDGGYQVEVDVFGRPVQIITRKTPIQGDNLFLTIDYYVQKAAENAIDDHIKNMQKKNININAAAAVVMNPKTGEILALVSRPAYNPNWFVGGISKNKWSLINNNSDNPMSNKAIAGEYPPGSIFKIVTGIAALELGKVNSEEKIFDNGMHWKVKKRNAENEALGWINFKDALSKSDNVFFYEMGLRLGIDNLEKFARLFCLGERTGIILSEESSGLVANREYKKKYFNEEWYDSETADAAIGQGYQLITPLQAAMLLSQIANEGHKYQPYLVKKITNFRGEVIKTFEPKKTDQIKISKQTLKLMQESLRGVVLNGTVAELFKDFPIKIAGKTGTAENSGRDHSWFVCYGPYDDPNIVVVVIIEHGGYGATAAAPIAKKILEAAFNLDKY